MRQEPWQHRYVTANGIRMHYVEQGEGYPVVLCHGWPEIWYSWHHQIPALAGAGLRVIVPDLRGYGETDKPAEVEAYDIHHLVGDMVGLLDALTLGKAAFVGHDWGSIVVWAVAAMHPERVERVASLAIPYRGPNGFPPTKVLQEIPDKRFNYVLYFQEPGSAEKFLESDIGTYLRRLYEFSSANPNFLSEAEFAVFAEAFRKGGFRGPINFYRNIDRNWETTRHLAEKVIECPALLVTVDKQRTPLFPGAPWTPPGYEPSPGGPGYPPEMERWVPKLRHEVITDCGHWVGQEKPQETNRILMDFLGEMAKR